MQIIRTSPNDQAELVIQGGGPDADPSVSAAVPHLV